MIRESLPRIPEFARDRTIARSISQRSAAGSSSVPGRSRSGTRSRVRALELERGVSVGSAYGWALRRAIVTRGLKRYR